MIKDSLRLTFKAAMMNLTKHAQEFVSEVTSPKLKETLIKAVQSGKLTGVEILNNTVDAIGHASFPTVSQQTPAIA